MYWTLATAIAIAQPHPERAAVGLAEALRSGDPAAIEGRTHHLWAHLDGACEQGSAVACRARGRSTLASAIEAHGGPLPAAIPIEVGRLPPGRPVPAPGGDWVALSPTGALLDRSGAALGPVIHGADAAFLVQDQLVFVDVSSSTYEVAVLGPEGVHALHLSPPADGETFCGASTDGSRFLVDAMTGPCRNVFRANRYAVDLATGRLDAIGLSPADPLAVSTPDGRRWRVEGGVLERAAPDGSVALVRLPNVVDAVPGRLEPHPDGRSVRLATGQLFRLSGAPTDLPAWVTTEAEATLGPVTPRPSQTWWDDAPTVPHPDDRIHVFMGPDPLSRSVMGRWPFDELKVPPKTSLLIAVGDRALWTARRDDPAIAWARHPKVPAYVVDRDGAPLAGVATGFTAPGRGGEHNDPVTDLEGRSVRYEGWSPDDGWEHQGDEWVLPAPVPGIGPTPPWPGDDRLRGRWRLPSGAPAPDLSSEEAETEGRLYWFSTLRMAVFGIDGHTLLVLPRGGPPVLWTR